MIKRWLYNARSFAVPQNLMPSILTVVMALGVSGFNIWLGLLAVLGVCLVHLGGNLLDDYFDWQDELLDYREELRKEGEKAFTDKYPYLRDGSTTLGQLKAAIAVFFGLAVLCGLIIWWVRDFDMTLVVIAAIAGFLCFFYSAPPFKLGFHGLGELVIGLCFGPCLVCGVYESACGGLMTEDGFAWHILMLGCAIGMFVTNILYTHSFVERHVDDVSHKKTLAVLLKTDAAGLTAYAIFLFVPFLLVVGCVVMGYIHWAYSLVLLMLPRAIWVMWAMVMFAKKVEVPTDNPPRWLGPMDNWDKVEPENRYYLMRWFAMRNVNTGFCLIMALVKITLYIISIVG
ncbi:MAG: prenyltransferase [Paludibacteraceae bacterium]|jgi:1,4-dihydroxy-2-naphthoate octaprenyltransferase|nr:prenyltransferase [Paludibacteraceae bacterium]